MIRWIGSLLLAVTSQLAIAQLTVSVDRTQVSEVDLVNLTIQVDGTTATGNPDFSPLEKDFDIQNISGPNRSSRISLISGKAISEVNVSWILRLRPKRLGTLTIPSMIVGGFQSQPIDIEVVQQTAAMKRKMDQLVFFETEVDTTETYVQGQILYAIRLYYQENISGDFPPPPEVEDAVVEVIEGERRYDAISNNRRYFVLEKRYAIYPQKSGTLEIPKQIFSGSRVSRGFFGTRDPVMTISESHDIKVNPRPSSFTGEHWLPARSVTLAETWSQSPPQFKVGEPVNRTLTLIADGVAVSLLPPMDMDNIPNLKTYTDPPIEDQDVSDTGIRSTSVTTIGIVPTAPGTITIPEIRVPWWNTETDQLEVEVIPAQTFQVASANVSAPDMTQELQTPQTLVTPGPVETIVKEVTNPLWQYATYALAILWVSTLLLWWWSISRRPAAARPSQDIQKTDGEPELFAKLKAACKGNEPQLARNLLFLWTKSRFPEVESTRDVLKFGGSREFLDEVTGLETALYSPSATGEWNGQALLNEVEALRKRKPVSKASTSLTPTLNPV